MEEDLRKKTKERKKMVDGNGQKRRSEQFLFIVQNLVGERKQKR